VNKLDLIYLRISQIMDDCQRLIAIQGLTPVRLNKMAASGMTGNRHLSIG